MGAKIYVTGKRATSGVELRARAAVPVLHLHALVYILDVGEHTQG